MKQCTKREWEEILETNEWLMLTGNRYFDDIPDEYEMPSHEIFEALIEEKTGGILSGHEIRGIIYRIYGVRL